MTVLQCEKFTDKTVAVKFHDGQIIYGLLRSVIRRTRFIQGVVVLRLGIEKRKGRQREIFLPVSTIAWMGERL
jgi:hypothetical protein